MTNIEYKAGSNGADHEAPRSDGDEYTIVDATVLDGPSASTSSGLHARRGSSLAGAGSAYSHQPAWTGLALNAPSTGLDSDNLAVRSGPQTYSGLPASNASLYSQPPADWHANAFHRSQASEAAMDHYATFNQGATGSFTDTNVRTSPALAFDNLHLSTVNNYGPAPGLPASPQSCKEGWMSCSSSDGLDLRSVAHQMRTQSPSFAASTHLLRRDGIRKKNARFEIPAERNLRTIDQLINQTNDEQELKELKQQKRLLRNRQAALDSRQRKKQHTERLEEEKKNFTAVITDMEEELHAYRMQEAEWVRAKEGWTSAQQQYQRYIDSLVMEKEELVQRHTLETGDLRKKNAVLMERLHRMDGVSMSAVTSSTGYSADFSDFDSLNVNGWEDFPVSHEFSIESRPDAQGSVANTPKTGLRDSTLPEDRAVASGFLLMLLLCGAWVASRSSGSAPAVIPSIPDDMRLASATVLDSLYRGSGIDLDGQLDVDSVQAHAPRLSSTSFQKTTLGSYEIANPSRPSLELIHQQLTTPSQQQLRDQVFSLTPGQYNDMTSGIAYPPTIFSPNARNVGDVLDTVQTLPEGTVADTYAKSLLKGKVSTQVLKDFARMVAESRSEVGVQWKTEHLG